MKYPWNNLSEELFLQLFFNIEGYDLSKIITESKYDELSDKFISSSETRSFSKLSLEEIILFDSEVSSFTG